MTVVDRGGFERSEMIGCNQDVAQDWRWPVNQGGKKEVSSRLGKNWSVHSGKQAVHRDVKQENIPELKRARQMANLGY